jgi:hypothetical protein
MGSMSEITGEHPTYDWLLGFYQEYIGGHTRLMDRARGAEAECEKLRGLLDRESTHYHSVSGDLEEARDLIRLLFNTMDRWGWGLNTPAYLDARTYLADSPKVEGL